MSLQRVPIKDFRGGLNTRDGSFDLQANESPDLLNITISALVGTLETRKGKERIDISGLPNENVDYAKQVVIGSTGKRFLMLSINGAIYMMEPDGKVKKVHTGTAGTIWDFEVFADAAYKDWVYMGNGVDAMLKWDGEAAEAVAWPAGKGTIPKGGVLCVWENRMFITYEGTHSQRLYFSEFSDPEATIAEYGFVDIRGSEEDLDSIQDLAVLGARLIVLKRRGVFFVSSPVTMANRHIGGPGVWGRFQTTVLEDKVYFFNPQGIFSTGGVQVSMESGSINNYFPKELNKNKLETARIMSTKDTYPRLLLTIPTGTSNFNDKLIEMVPHINFRRIGGRRYLLLPAFMLHSISATSLAAWNPTGTEEMLVGPAGGTGAPEATVRDTFQGAEENPLAKAGWVARVKGLFPCVNKGRIANQTLKEIVERVWTKRTELEGEPEGAMWNTEFTSPEVSIELRSTTFSTEVPTTGVELFLAMAADHEHGYDVKFWYNKPSKKTVVEVFKEPTNEVIATFSLSVEPTKGTKYAATLKEGKIKIWIFTPTSGWALAGEVADATYTKGFCGFRVDGSSIFTCLRNFGANAIVGGGATTTARVYRLFQGTTDDGAVIQSHWKSAWTVVQGEEPKERIRRLNVELSGDAIVDVFRDFQSSASFTQKLPKAGESKEFGEPAANEAEGLEYRFVKVRPETHGRFHQVQLRSDPEGKPFVVNAMELAVRGGKEH